MESHLGSVDWGIIAILVGVAGYLAVKVIDQGEKLAGLLAHKEDTIARFDRQDVVLDAMDTKLDAIMLRMGVRTTPPRGGDRST